MDLPQKNGLKGAALPRLAPLSEVSPRDIVAALQDIEVARWLIHVPYPYKLENAKAFLTANSDPDTPVKAIVVGGRFAGVVGLKRELGYWLARPFWRQGIASYAANLMLAAQFNREDTAIISGHFAGNDRSARVLKKLGFRYSHDETATPRSTGLPVVVHRMALSRSDWWATSTLPLQTARLTLRPLSQSDAFDLARIGGQPGVASMFQSIAIPWPAPHLTEWIQKAAWTGHLPFRLAVCLKDGALIGTVGAGGDPVGIGYFIDPAHAGKGYATEAGHAVLSMLFARFDPDFIIAEHFDDNPASGRVLRKLGFEKTGQSRARSLARLEPAANTLYRVKREDLRKPQ
jgi:RimJ/RimL family protein N-acetyltransferase